MSKEQPLQHSGIVINSTKNVSKDTEPIQILYPSKATNEQLKKKYKESLLRERPETLFADHFKNGGISNLIFYSHNPEAWHSAIRLHYPTVIRKGISNGWKLQVLENEHSECTTTINLYKTGTITVQGDVRQFTKDFSEVRDKAQLQKNAATSCASQGEQLQNDPSDERSNEDSEPDIKETSLLHHSLATMKLQFTRLEVELVQLRETMSSLASAQTENLHKNLNEEEYRKDIEALRKEVKDLKWEKDKLDRQLLSQSEELRQLKEESEAHSKQLLCLTEKLLHRGQQGNMPTEGNPLHCAPTEEGPRTPAPHPSGLPSTTSSPATALHTEEQAEIILLMDSNGKFLKERKLFPNHRTKKLWCANTEKAMDILSGGQLGSPTHIIIHTGTNDLQTQEERVAMSLRQVIEKASSNFPDSRIVVSTLLPRRDFHPDTINWINTSVSRDCAMKPNVFLAQHQSLNLDSLFDSVHLHKTAVKTFAKTLKDIALNRMRHTPQRISSPHHQWKQAHPVKQLHRTTENVRPPQSRPSAFRHPKPQRSVPTQSNSQGQPQQRLVDDQKQSYAQAASRASVPHPTTILDPALSPSYLPPSTSTELTDIQQMLSRLCSHLIGQ